MAVEGWYKNRGSAPAAPFVRALVRLPRVGIYGSVDFLVDSGADSCSLHPYDIRSLRIDRSQLKPVTATSRGIGGTLSYHVEPAVLYFVGGNNSIQWRCSDFRICADIGDPSVAEVAEELPSLLGRNFQNLGLNVSNSDMGQFAILPYWLNGNVILSDRPTQISLSP